MSETLARPALPTLLAQQRELVDHRETSATDLGFSLRHGFATRREVIRWYQAAIVRTFGAVCDTWHPARLREDHTLLQTLIVSEQRWRWATDTPLDRDVAEANRRVIEEEALVPATHDAYNQLRKMAGEYIGSDDQQTYTEDDVDPGHHEIAWRPAFSRKDDEQARALRQLWGGFGDADTLRTWLHGLEQPTNGALDRDFAARVMRDEVALEHLLVGGAGPAESRLYRERLAIQKLLPAFRAGIERMDAGELAKRARTGGLEAAQG